MRGFFCAWTTSSTDFSNTSATSSKAGMIFAHKTTWRSLLDLEHPDETSSRKFSVRQQHNGGPQGTKLLRQFAD